MLFNNLLAVTANSSTEGSISRNASAPATSHWLRDSGMADKVIMGVETRDVMSKIVWTVFFKGGRT